MTGAAKSEALKRWSVGSRPSAGLSPLEFISYAEESGLIVPLGRWVMLDVVRRWQNGVTRELTCAWP